MLARPDLSMCSGTHQVVTLGEAMLRLTACRGVRIRDARALDVYVAGAEANVAAGLSRLGVSAAWVSRLPSNALGARVADDLRAMGVDVAHIAWTDEGRLGVFFSEPGAPPRPTSVVYDREGSAFAGMCVEHLDVDVLDGAAWAMVSGIVPALGDAGAALASHFFDAAASRGVAVCLDINHRALLWSAQAAREGLMPSIRRASLVVCAERDARVVFGLAGASEDALVGMRALAAPSGTVVLTCGAQGAIACGPDGTVHRAGAMQTDIIDRFGMGDAFVAGLLAGLLEGPLADALRLGCAAAELTGTVLGDQLRADRREVAALAARGARGQHGDEPATIAQQVAR